MSRIGVEGVWVGDSLRDVSLDVPGGAVTAVVGGDGAGKTTLLRLLVGAVVPDRGQVFVPDRAEDIGFVPTGAGYYPDLTVDENLRFVGAAYGLRSEVWTRRRDYVLDLTGLGAFTGRLARDLSGGMRQKLALAAGTLHHPRLLVLDEPTTGVDPVVRVDLWRIIANAAAAGVHVVVATSYIDEAERAARVLALHDGTCLLEGRPVVLSRSMPGTLVDVDQPEFPDLAWRRGAGWRQWVPNGAEVPKGVVRPAGFEDAVIVATLSHDLPLPRGDDMTLLELSAVTKRFGDFIANEDVTFSVGAGEVVGLLGANGAGKTTAIRQALGLMEPTQGSVTQFGRLPSRETRIRVGYVPQGLGLWTDLTVDENLEFAARAYNATTPTAAADTGVDGELQVKDLPLGQRRRVAFTAALGHDPELLVLDEPTSGVSPLARSRLWDVIRSRADTGAGVLVSTHFMDEARQCDRLLIMAEGRIVLRGTYDDIVGEHRVVEVESDDWATVYGALDAAGFGCGVAGTAVRVLSDDVAAVETALESLNLPIRMATGPATLEETMVAVAKGPRDATGGSTI